MADKEPPQTSMLLTSAYAMLFLAWCLPFYINVPPNLNLIGIVVVILFIGSHRSLKLRDVTITPPGERDIITKEDAMRFPIVGSAVLFGLFIVLKLVPRDLVNLVLSVYFSAIGAYALASLVEPLTVPFLPLIYGKGAAPKEYGRIYQVTYVGPLPLIFTAPQLCCIVAALPVVGLYFKTKYWLLNNLLGIAFAVQGIEAVSLGSFKVASILLVGLFFYDIFWVFGTDKILSGESVMVTVAKGLDAPIKLLFPKLANMTAVLEAEAATAANATLAALAANVTKAAPVFNAAGERLEFSMLGLGDIVIPGFFLALLLRFDAERANADPKQGASGTFPKPFFYSNLVAYVAGLLATVLVMEFFKAAQPALLYLVPACLLGALAMAATRGELAALFAYDEEEIAEAAGGSSEEDKGEKPKEAESNGDWAAAAFESKKIK
mmetsp:Transcript_42589/g.86105  ORF Transcript_42589/g.86105 Transcript_42589/m.86105 type:complete len:436 (-) Transcript_42589:106-1413(-)